MFKDITINLSGPICKCDEENLAWFLSLDRMYISCNNCKIELCIPINKMYHSFNLDKPYPGKTDRKPYNTNNIIPIKKD